MRISALITVARMPMPPSANTTSSTDTSPSAAAISVRNTNVSRLKRGEILSSKVGGPDAVCPTPIGYFSRSPDPIEMRYRYSMADVSTPVNSTTPAATR
jgi:hypothetical protein